MSRRNPRKGFVLIVTTVVLVVLLALAGLGIDIGRMYVIKSELQAFTDAAALTAALQMDGTAAGLGRARDAAAKLATGPNAMKWDLGTKTVTDITATFATGELAPDPKTWQKEPRDAGSSRYVRVAAIAPAPLIFLRAFQVVQADFSTVAASSVAFKAGGSARLLP